LAFHQGSVSRTELKEAIMTHRKCILGSTCAAAMIAILAQPAAAASWSRGFVVNDYGFAFHYGSRPGAAETDPGSDCPHGSSVHFLDESNMRKALEQQPWRSKLEIDNIIKPPGIEQARLPTYVRFYVWGRAASYRGWRKGIETYVNPFAASDPGQPEVTGKIADGFNLDGKVKANDFISPDGERGIDNALYRAWGCDAPFRGPATATLDLRENTQMLEGLYTVLIRISGNQDPANDDDATLEIGYSPDKIVKDARGDVAPGYSYRIVKTAEYTKLKARIKDGVVETEQVAEVHVPRIGWFYDQMGDADFHNGRVRLNINADGKASGLVGGYRNWRDLLAENTFAQTGAEQGIRDHEDAVSLYYALKRNADGMPDPQTGQNLGISMAYRIKAVRAFVVDPAKPAEIRVLQQEEPRKKKFEIMRATMIKAVTTRMVQDVPPGAGEGQYPAMERTIADLPSKDFFLKTLDSPGRTQPKELDEDGNVVKPGQRVNNAAPATIAAASKP
jgi:hypothetical protein